MTQTAEAAIYADEESLSRLTRWYRWFRRYPVIPVFIILLLLFAAVFAQNLTSHDPERALALDDNEIAPMWQSTGSTKYILGTDHLGRDVLARIIYGTRISLIVGIIVLVLSGAMGTAIGIVSGYFGGNVDEVLMRLVDTVLAVPFILVALVVAIILGNSLNIVVVLLVAFFWTGFARQIRAETLQLKTADYVSFAKLSGASDIRIMYRHILPGVFSTFLVISTLTVGTVILVESILTFLGVGVPGPTPTWGAMISDGRNYLTTGWWIAFFPGIALLLTVLAFNFLGDWLRDELDPKLRQLTQ
ncbi:MAG: ABC transporter permease [Gammaproteobacteria bacterium]|nr:ABC transporter permease [Gammaproteobacteria bacterium]